MEIAGQTRCASDRDLFRFDVGWNSARRFGIDDCFSVARMTFEHPSNEDRDTTGARLSSVSASKPSRLLLTLIDGDGFRLPN